MPVDHAPKSLVWKGNSIHSKYGRKVSSIRSVSIIRRTEGVAQNNQDDDDEPPPLCVDSDSSDDEQDDVPPPLCVDSDSSDDGQDDVPLPLCVDSEGSDDEQDSTKSSVDSDSTESLLRWCNARPPSQGGQEFHKSMKAERDQHNSADQKPLDPNRPPLQSAKLGSRLHDEVEPNLSVTTNPPTAVTWDWQHSTAQAKGP
jgi:hypothetical protein